MVISVKQSTSGPLLVLLRGYRSMTFLIVFFCFSVQYKGYLRWPMTFVLLLTSKRQVNTTTIEERLPWP